MKKKKRKKKKVSSREKHAKTLSQIVSGMVEEYLSGLYYRTVFKSRRRRGKRSWGHRR